MQASGQSGREKQLQAGKPGTLDHSDVTSSSEGHCRPAAARNRDAVFVKRGVALIDQISKSYRVEHLCPVDCAENLASASSGLVVCCVVRLAVVFMSRKLTRRLEHVSCLHQTIISFILRSSLRDAVLCLGDVAGMKLSRRRRDVGLPSHSPRPWVTTSYHHAEEESSSSSHQLFLNFIALHSTLSEILNYQGLASQVVS